MTKYKPRGIFIKQREERKWIVCFGGDEFPFIQKSHAFASARVAMEYYDDVKLYEETIIHTRTGCFRLPDTRFRIDITYKLNYPTI